MPSSFERHMVAPVLPTTLGEQEWLPLPYTEFNFYPGVNSFYVPQPLDPERLKSSLAETLQLFPVHSGIVTKNPACQKWQVQLINQPVELLIGTTDEAGPFAENWKGDRHPDYYDELPRGNVTQTEGLPLFKARITTWSKTGHTAIMIAQSFVTGDAFAGVGFAIFWSNLYQGRAPPFTPTFEKYYLPPAEIELRSTQATDLEQLSWMAADFTEDWHCNRLDRMEEDTERVDLTFDAEFVDSVWNAVRMNAEASRITRNDAFHGYLTSVLQGIREKPVEYIHCLVALRGRTFPYNKQVVHLPHSTLGNNYMILGKRLDPRARTCPSSLAMSFYKARTEVKDPNKLGRMYMLYNSFYEKAIARDRYFVDGGYKDAISMNCLVNVNLHAAHFGFPDYAGQFEWEPLENFFQTTGAHPVRLPNGKWKKRDPRGISLVCRLRHDYVEPFKDRLEADRITFAKVAVETVGFKPAIIGAKL